MKVTVPAAITALQYCKCPCPGCRHPRIDTGFLCLADPLSCPGHRFEWQTCAKPAPAVEPARHARQAA